MKVIGWISYEDTEEWMEESIGGFGGFFQEKMRWKDYLEIMSEPYLYYESLREEILDKNIRITGNEHQHSSNGVPVFSDGTIGSFSFRAWGDIMAAIWSEAEDKDYCYMDFYV